MKILVVLSRFPYPLEKGDKLRAYHQIRCLSEKHEVYLAAMHYHPVAESDILQLKPFCKDIFLLDNTLLRRCWNVLRAFFKGLPIQCGMFYSQQNARELNRIVHAVQPDWIYCQLFRMAEYVKDMPIKKILDYQDVFSKGMWRRYEHAPWYQKPFFKMEARRVARYEAEIFECFDHKTIITAVDRNLIPHPRREEIVVVPNGVELEKFTYRDEPKEYDLVFSGNMGYAPNVDAAEYLVQEILPLLLDEFPDLRVVLCGANPASRVLALQSDHVKVTGWVDSMRDWYARSRVFIAPMRMGTGLQNKLLEAMAMRLPCITSPLAAAPLGDALPQGVLLSCSTPADYRDEVIRMLHDETIRQHLGEAGHQFVQEHYAWESAVNILSNLMQAAE